MALNNLSAKAWVKLTQTVWITRKLLQWSGRAPLDFNTTFVIKRQMMKTTTAILIDRPLDETRVKLIELFTQKNQYVFDPDIQHGDTVKASVHLDCQFVGISQTQQECESVFDILTDQESLHSITLLDKEQYRNPLSLIEGNSVDFLLTELPKLDFKNNNENTHINLAESLKAWREKLKAKAYIALIVSDQRYQDQYYARHADVIEAIKEAGFTLQGLINVIQDQNALKARGYPSTYVPNIINEYVVIARK